MYKIKVNFENPKDRAHDHDHDHDDHDHDHDHGATEHAHDEDNEPIIIEAEEGLTLLEAIVLNKMHLNHNCGGVCACTTCHIYVHKGDNFLEELTDKEEDFIDRARQPTLESRLACQCALLEGEGEIEITIPDQGDIIGHEH